MLGILGMWSSLLITQLISFFVAFLAWMWLEDIATMKQCMDIEEVGVNWTIAKANEEVWLLSATKMLDVSWAVLVKPSFQW